MIVKSRPLLCELHAHTTWSDGTFPLGQLVDLYGMHAFDVLVVTDHVLRSDDPWPQEHPGGAWVEQSCHDAYLDAIAEQAARALAQYDLLVIPGLELTYNDPDPDEAGHAVAVGLRRFVGMDGGLAQAMGDARSAGAAIVAAHPHAAGTARPGSPPRTTRRFHRDWRMLGGLVDRYELFNQREVFEWVANEGLPSIASGDFHRLEHLTSWKTLLPCEKSEPAVISYLRSGRPAYITRLDRAPRALVAA